MGWAGALSCGMQPGSAYVVNEVVDAGTGEAFPTRFPSDRKTSSRSSWSPSTMSPIPRRSGDLRRPSGGSGGYGSGHGCADCSSPGHPFYCLKAVSDVAAETLPDFSAYTDNLGHLRLPALLAHVAIDRAFGRGWPGWARMPEGAIAMAAAWVR